MKRNIICIAMVVLGANVVLAQGLVQDRIEAQRVAFITQRLELTPDESAAFWPVYNEFKDKQRTLRESANPRKGFRQLNDSEALEIIEAQFAMEESQIKLKREYFGKLKEIIPPRKLVRLGAIEQQFSREVLNTLRQRRQGKN